MNSAILPLPASGIDGNDFACLQTRVRGSLQLGRWSNCGRSSGCAHFSRLLVNISSFGANHSGRSRVPSCTKMVPGKSFRLLVNTLEPSVDGTPLAKITTFPALPFLISENGLPTAQGSLDPRSLSIRAVCVVVNQVSVLRHWLRDSGLQ